VSDPAILGHRIEVRSQCQLLLMFVTRAASRNEGMYTPQQSDYTALWNRVRTAGQPEVARTTRRTMKSLLRRVLHRVRRARLTRKVWPITPVKGLEQPGIEPLTLSQFLETSLQETHVRRHHCAGCNPADDE
jgi:hypothetical protein